jgi:3-hydroxybutyryl-CoA dehydrogenase
VKPPILVLGAGLMGSQIACEYALGGHPVTVAARDPERARERIRAAFDLARSLDLADSPTLAAAAARLRVATPAAALATPFDLVVESVGEDLELKIALLAEAADASPGAILATNTSSLSIAAIGDGVGRPELVLGTHYWNPPLLMPPVEVVLGAGTAVAVGERVTAILAALGKQPVTVERDVPGFIWNRLQAALLREALWLVENGVAAPETVDRVVRSGLARRAALSGPFETIALGGEAVWEALAENLFPLLSNADAAGELARWVPADPGAIAALRARRDAGLAAQLRRQADGEG